MADIYSRNPILQQDRIKGSERSLYLTCAAPLKRSTGCILFSVRIPAETSEDDLILSWEAEMSPFPDFPAASHGTSALIRSIWHRALFVFLHRVVYLLVMRSKNLSGYSDNRPAFGVAESMPFPPQDCAVSCVSARVVWGKSWEMVSYVSGCEIGVTFAIVCFNFQNAEYTYFNLHLLDEGPKINLLSSWKQGKNKNTYFLLSYYLKIWVCANTQHGFCCCDYYYSSL